MKYKVKYFEIEDNKIKLYIKKEKDLLYQLIKCDLTFGNCNENYLGSSIDSKNKYVILTFVLRSYKDIEPYIKYGIR